MKKEEDINVLKSVLPQLFKEGNGMESNVDERSNGMNKIINYVYIGNVYNANDKSELMKNKIKYVLTCGHEIKIERYPNIKYKQLSIYDSPTCNITSFFKEAFSFITTAISSKQNILVHCYSGISRSPSIIIAYIMKTQAKSFTSSFWLVKQHHPRTFPNFHFIHLLSSYKP